MTEKSKINFLIDACMFLCMMPLAGIGFLMKFVLIPGKERMAAYGRNVDLFFLGFDRHEWGTLHLWTAYILLALFAAHLVLHLAWIAAWWRKMVSNRKAQFIAAIAFILVCLCLLLFPFLITPEVHDAAPGFRSEQHTGKAPGQGFMKGRQNW